MARLTMDLYSSEAGPPPRSVPVSAIVLTADESANIERCLASLGWAQQVVVVDSGSTDDTVARAVAAGASVLMEPWRGYGAQREFAMRHSTVRHDWVYFVDADEWVSQELAQEIASTLVDPRHVAYSQRWRLVFQGRWIRHCGWYRGSWAVRLMHRATARFDPESFGERAQVDGSTGRLRHDLVDEDRKGLASWLHKHVRYAELEAARRDTMAPITRRWRTFRAQRAVDTRPLARAVAKDLVFPLVPAQPLALFVYMYVVKAGFLDGMAGLRFCLYHAWFQLTVEALRRPDTGNPAVPAQGQRTEAREMAGT
jgi:glycosyltransferase involved in cell wall biosynthesis